MITATVLTDGCTAHNIPESQVAYWWTVVGEKDAVVSVCICCGGPSPSGATRCKKCPEEVGAK